MNQLDVPTKLSLKFTYCIEDLLYSALRPEFAVCVSVYATSHQECDDPLIWCANAVN